MSRARDIWRWIIVQRVLCWLGAHKRYDGAGHCMRCHAPAIPCAICGRPYYEHDDGDNCEMWTDGAA